MPERIIIYGPPVRDSKKPASYTRAEFELHEVAGRIVSNPEYPPERREELLLYCDMVEEAHIQGQVDTQKELAVILLEQAGLVPVRKKRGIDLKPAA